MSLPAADIDAACKAFAAYVTLARRHADEPDLWDHDERVQSRRAAHDRFTALFEAIQ